MHQYEYMIMQGWKEWKENSKPWGLYILNQKIMSRNIQFNEHMSEKGMSY